MIRPDECIDNKISGNSVLSQNQKLTAGRQNLLSAIWCGRNAVTLGAMPNGDPPSLMLWGTEDQACYKRYNAGQSGVHIR